MSTWNWWARPSAPWRGGAAPSRPFVSDLSARDFTCSWVRVGCLSVWPSVPASSTPPAGQAGAVLQQKTQNVELTNFTEAMYSARESAMERMQQSALSVGGQGVVQVKVTEGPMSFARHAVGFTAWGTAVTLVAESHKYVSPEVVLPLDDTVVSFAAQSLRGRDPGDGLGCLGPGLRVNCGS
jgi:uncharacterized protein YbjQ (UPF0145 family)